MPNLNYCTFSSSGLRQHRNSMHGRKGPARTMFGVIEQPGNTMCDRCGFAALDTFELRSHVMEKHGEMWDWK